MSALVASFADEAALVHATRRLRAAGLAQIEAYTPYPVEALDALLPRSRWPLPAIVFLGGALGLVLGFGMQWYAAAVGYPINIGGRPLASWPAFIPIAFEIAVLCAVLAGFVGFLWLAGLPRPHQPVAAIPGFERASHDRFFLLVDPTGSPVEPAAAHRLMEQCAPCSLDIWPS